MALNIVISDKQDNNIYIDDVAQFTEEYPERPVQNRCRSKENHAIWVGTRCSSDAKASLSCRNVLRSAGACVRRCKSDGNQASAGRFQ